MCKGKNDLDLRIRDATKLHGHLGPFLVIGVRTGILANRVLNANAGRTSKLRVTARLPLLTPFSCILDGIQATTQCTVGNQRLSVENSPSKIEVSFRSQNEGKSLKIGVKPEVTEKLKVGFSQGASNEALAWEIASMTDGELFTLLK